MSSIPLGPFRLTEPLARGGMARVWRGVHEDQGVPVAVKVLDTRHVYSTQARRAFRHEVRAVAGLDHPGIVLVLDFGELPEEAEIATSGDLIAGSPYLVMELASRGSLKGAPRVLPWADLRGILLSLLDALAHAHARGVIHRDLKPGNILISDGDDLRPGVKLSDFGIAHAVDGARAWSVDAGTPRYMAPEQFQARWRDFGPWTDLYALGCVAWRYATGQTPYRVRGAQALAAAHLGEPLPPFTPRSVVPDGFEAWLRRLLRKDARHRFQRAADAAWALAQLPEPAPTPRRTMELPTNPPIALDATLVPEGSEEPTEVIDLVAAFCEPVDGDAHTVMPPVPTTWRRPTAADPLVLRGAGLGLYGLRTIPLVGRVRERDVMWQALVEATDSRTARCVVLRGAAGNGKSRLAQWICRRAHEVGATSVLWAVHSPDPTPRDGLPALVERAYGCVGLGRARTRVRLALQLRLEGADPEVEADALTELIRPALPGEASAVTFAAAEERYALVARVLRRRSASRPVAVWIDDAQWGSDAAAFVHWFGEHHAEVPAVFLLTVQSEALAERPRERGILDAILGLPFAAALPVDPLDPQSRSDLVRVLLGLSGDLANRLADRTAGNPLFAVQLVGDWVERGLLVPTREGFALRRGAPIDLPDSLHNVWADRVDRLMRDRSPAARVALELAATLGQEVDDGEWRAICGTTADPDGLVDALVALALARPRAGGWAFAHGMLRESLVRMAAQAGRGAAHDLACARALAGRGLHAREGRHLYAAGAWEAAIDPLRRGVEAAVARYDLDDARALLARHDDAIHRASPSPADPRWGRGWLVAAAVYDAASELDDAVREARRAATMARRHGWNDLLPQALRRLGNIGKSRGNLPYAERLLRQALELHEAAGDPSAIAGCVLDLAHTAILGGDSTRARPLLDRARDLFHDRGDRGGIGRCVRFVGDCERLDGAWEVAALRFAEAHRILLEAGARATAASALHGVAEMNRLMGRIDEAESGYRQVIAMNDARGAPSEIPRLNLGLCQLTRGEYAAARDTLIPVQERWRNQRKRGYLAAIHSALLAVSAGLGDWPAFDEHLDQCATLLAATGMVDIDVALAAELAGDLAHGAGEAARSRAARALALDHWNKLGDADRANALAATLADPESPQPANPDPG